MMRTGDDRDSVKDYWMELDSDDESGGVGRSGRESGGKDFRFPAEDHHVKEDSLGAAVARLEGKYVALVNRNTARSAVIQSMVETIGSAASGNTSAVMEDISDDPELAKLAASFDDLLAAVRRSGALPGATELERNAAFQKILDAASAGFMMMDENFRVLPGYSKSCEHLLGAGNMDGQHLFDILGLSGGKKEKHKKMFEFLNALVNRLLPEEDMEPLNPVKEIRLSVPVKPGRTGTDVPPEMERRRRPRKMIGTRWLKSRFLLIERGSDRPPHILWVLEDISRQKDMATEIVAIDRENGWLRDLAGNPDFFRDILVRALRETKESEKRLNDPRLVAGAPRLFAAGMSQGIESIREECLAIGLDHVSTLAGNLNVFLSAMRQEESFRDADMAKAQNIVRGIRESLEEVVEKTEKILGVAIDENDDVAPRAAVSVPISQLREICRLPIKDVYRKKILKILAAARSVPANKGLARTLKAIPNLTIRYGKAVVFHFMDNEVRVDCETAQALNDPLLHLLRNAFEHGIEPVKERYELGKPEEGHVVLTIRPEAESLVLTVSDDGRGLDPRRLREIALDKGLITEKKARQMSDLDCLGLIFNPVFSTAEEESGIERRGCGLDAVYAAIRDKLGGSIHIDSKIGRGTAFIIRVPQLPPEATPASPTC